MKILNKSFLRVTATVMIGSLLYGQFAYAQTQREYDDSQLLQQNMDAITQMAQMETQQQKFFNYALLGEIPLTGTPSYVAITEQEIKILGKVNTLMHLKFKQFHGTRYPEARNLFNNLYQQLAWDTKGFKANVNEARAGNLIGRQFSLDMLKVNQLLQKDQLFAKAIEKYAFAVN